MGLCGDARELLNQLAAQFRRNLLDGLDLASLENLLDSPACALREAQQVVHLLGRRGGGTVAVLPALTGLVRRALLVVRLGGLLVALRRGLLRIRLLRRLLDWRHLRGGRAVVQLRLDGAPHEVEHVVDLLLKLLRAEAVGKLDLDRARSGNGTSTFHAGSALYGR